MAESNDINNDFVQKSGVCAMASYATVIEYFSNKNVKIEQVLTRYLNHFMSIFMKDIASPKN